MRMFTSSIRWAFNVHDWKPTKEQWKLCVQCVQKEEVERCYKFAFKEDCKSSLMGRLLMRKAVNESLGMPYNEIMFSRTSSGKPYLLGEEKKDISFNVSHNGDFCVLASELHWNVGVDVMKTELRGTRSVTEFFNRMEKQFSPSEWNYITMPGLEKEQLQRFYRIWCLKESYVKATGTGIIYDLQSLSFICHTPILEQNSVTTDTQLFINNELQNEWTFEESYLGTDHCVAVALGPGNQVDLCKNNRPGQAQHFKLLNFEDLMKNCKPFETVRDDFWVHFVSKSEKQ